MSSSVLRIIKNNILLLLTSYKFLSIIIVACIMPLNTIYQLKYVGQWNDLTVLDGMLYEFGMFTLHYLIIVPLCIFVVYDLVKPSLVDNFIFFRIGSRNKLFLAKTLSCAITSLVLLLIMGIVSFVILFFNFQSEVRWGSSMLLAQSIKETMINLSLMNSPPYLIMAYQIFLVLLSLISISWLLLLFMEIIKRKSVALVITFLINFSILLLAKKNGADFILLPCANTFLLNMDISENACFALSKPIIYWLIVGGILFVLNYLVISRKDFLYEDAPEDES